MNILIQKEIKPEVVLKLDKWMHNDFTINGGQGYVGFSIEEEVCVVWVDWNGNPPNHNSLIANNQNIQGYGQYAFRIKGETLQCFHGHWQSFDEAAQKEYQMRKADFILLGGEE